MQIELREVKDLSGNQCTIYEVSVDGADPTPFQSFLNKYYPTHKSQIEDLLQKIKSIGMLGAKEPFFRLYEGKPGDGVCAIDEGGDCNFRLFCVRYGTVAIILGGGGIKDCAAWQDSEELRPHGEFAITVSNYITDKTKEKSEEISWNKNRDGFVGTSVA